MHDGQTKPTQMKVKICRGSKRIQEKIEFTFKYLWESKTETE